MANTKGQKELKTNWPNEEGLTARTQKQTGRQTNLTPQGNLGDVSKVLKRDRELI